MTLQYDFLCFVPIAIFHRTLQIRPMVSVQVLKYPILVPETSIDLLWRTFLNRSKLFPL
jgi:hypothetical protein